MSEALLNPDVENIRNQLCREKKLPSDLKLDYLYQSPMGVELTDDKVVVQVDDIYSDNDEKVKKWKHDNKFDPRKHELNYVERAVHEAVQDALPSPNRVLLRQYGHFDCPLTVDQRRDIRRLAKKPVELREEKRNVNYDTSVISVSEKPDGNLDNLGKSHYFQKDEKKWLDLLYQIGLGLSQLRSTRLVPRPSIGLYPDDIAFNYVKGQSMPLFRRRHLLSPSPKLNLYPIVDSKHSIRTDTKLEDLISEIVGLSSLPMKIFFLGLISKANKSLGGLPLSIERFLVWCYFAKVEEKRFLHLVKQLRDQLLDEEQQSTSLSAQLRALAEEAKVRYDSDGSSIPWPETRHSNPLTYMFIPRTTRDLRVGNIKGKVIGEGSYGKVYENVDDSTVTKQIMFDSTKPAETVISTNFSEDISQLSPEDFYLIDPRRKLSKLEQEQMEQDESESFPYELVGPKALGDLSSVMEKLQPRMDYTRKLELAKKWFCQLVHSLNTLHKAFHISHLDIKPENVLVFGADYDLRLADYDLMSSMNVAAHRPGGEMMTPDYRPFWLNEKPTFYDQNNWRLTGAEDRFSLGLVLAKIFMWLFSGTSQQTPNFNWQFLDSNDAFQRKLHNYGNCPQGPMDWEACAEWFDYIKTMFSNPALSHFGPQQIQRICSDLKRPSSDSWLLIFLTQSNYAYLSIVQYYIQRLDEKQKVELRHLYDAVDMMLDLERKRSHEFLLAPDYMTLALPDLKCAKPWDEKDLPETKKAIWNFVKLLKEENVLEKFVQPDMKLMARHYVALHNALKGLLPDVKHRVSGIAFVTRLASLYKEIHPEASEDECFLVALSWAFGESEDTSIPIHLKYYFPVS